MPTIWMDVDAALSEVPVNILALIDDTDFKTREESVTYNQAGMDLVWNFVSTAGVFTQTAVTPTSGGDYDWVNQGNGIYTIEIPASGGASINNDIEGFGWFVGYVTGILPWRGPIVGFRAAALNNALIDGGDVLDINTTQWNGTNVATPTVAGVPEVDVTHIEGASQSATDLKDFADAGYDPATNKVQGVVLVDTTTTNTDMVGTNGANTTIPDVAGIAATLHGITDGKIDDVQTTVDAIETDTQDLQTQIGTAGVGLTDLGGMSTGMKAEVNIEADAALTDYDPPTRTEATADKNEIIVEVDANETKIDAIQTTANAIEVDTQDIQNSIGIVEDLGNGTTLAKNNRDIAGATFITGTDSNEAIRDRGDTAWTTGAGGDATEAKQDSIIATIGTAGAGLNDLGGMSTAMKAEVNIEADAALSDYDPPTRTEATSDKDEIIVEIDANETKIDAVQTTVDNIETDTQDLQGRLPASLIAGRIDADTTAISGDVTAANNLELDYDGTGYAKTNSIIGTTTTNTDMVGTNGANTTVPDIAGTAATLHGITDGKVDDVQTTVDNIETDTQDLQSSIGTVEDLGNGTTLAKNNRDIAGATFATGTDSNESIRDRGDAAWLTGGGGAISQIINPNQVIPISIDLANTSTVRLGFMLINAVDDLPSTAEITPGTISIERKAIGGASWSAIITDAACSEQAGMVYYDEVFDTGAGYAEGDSIRITFKSQSVIADANTFEITDSNGVSFQTYIRETMRGTNSANTTVPDIAGTAATLHGITDGKVDTVDTKVDTIDTVVDAIKVVTDVLPNAGALTDIDTGINNIEAKLPTNYIMGSSIQADKDDEIDSIKTTVEALNNISSGDVQTACDTAITANTDIDNIDSGVNNIEAKLPTNYIMGSSVQTDKDDEIDAIKVVTDVLPNSGALTDIDAGVNNIEAKLPSKTYLTGTTNADGDVQLDEATGALPAGAFANHPTVGLNDDAITASKFDETTAYPIASADSGSTAVARVGADGDTLETLSDQIDGVQTSVDGIQNNTKFVATVPTNMLIPDSGDTMYKITAHFYDSDGNMEDPDNDEINILYEDVSGADKDAFFDDAGGSTGATAGVIDVNMWQMVRASTGVYESYYKLPNTETPEQWTASFKLEEASSLLNYSRSTNVVEEAPGSTTLADNTVNKDIIAEALKERDVSGAGAVSGSIYQDINDNIDTNETKIDTIYTEVGLIKTATDALPNAGALTDIDTGINNIEAKLPSKSYIAGTANPDGDIQLDEATGALVVGAYANHPDVDLNANQSGVTVGTVNALGTQAKADVQAECDSAITANTDINNIDTGVNNIETKLPSKSYLAGTANSDGDVQLDEATGALPAGAFTNHPDVDLNADQSAITIGIVNALGAQAKLDVNAEADIALSDIGLDHLIQVAVAGTDVTDNSIIAQIVSKSATADWDTFDNTTDALEAISDSGGGGLTAQQVRDAMKLAPTVGAPDVGSVDNHLDDIQAVTDNLPNSGSLTDIDTGVNNIEAKLPTNYIMGSSVQTDKDDEIDSIKSTVEGLNDLSAAQVNAEVDTALSDIRLDELMTSAIASQPVAGSIFADLTEDDGGTQRFNANALEQAPTGGTNPNVLIDTTINVVTDQTHFTLNSGSNDDDAYKNQAFVVYDASDSDSPSIRVCAGYVGSTRTVTLDSAPDFTIISGDGAKAFVTAPGTSAPTVGQIRTEMDDNSTKLIAIDTGVDNIELKLPTNYIMGSSAQTDKDDEIDAIKAVTDLLPNSGALTDIDTGINAIEAKLPTDYIMGSSVQTAKDDEIDSIKSTVEGLNNLSAAEVNAEVDTALSDIGLDHLVQVAVAGTDIVDNSIIAQIVSKSATADWDTFDNTTDSLEANTDSLSMVDGKVDTIDTVVDAIKVVADLLPNGGALTDIDTGVNNTEAKLPTNYIMGSSVQSGKDDEIDSIKSTVEGLNDLSSVNVQAACDAAITANTDINDIDTGVNNIEAKLPSKSYLTGSNNTDGDIELDEATGAFAAGAYTNHPDVDLNSDQSAVTIGTVNALGAQAKLDVNAECDTALSDIGLDHLIQVAVTGADVTDDSIIANIVSKAATPDWDTFDNTTDSLEAIVDGGGAGLSAQEVRDAMKLTPTGGAPASGSVDEHLDTIITDVGTVDTVVDAIKVVTDALPNSGALTDIDTGINNIEAKLPTNYIMGSSVQANKDDEIDAIKVRIELALPNAAPSGAAGLPTVDASNHIVGVQGSKNVFDDLNDINNSDILGMAIDGTATFAIAMKQILAYCGNDITRSGDVYTYRNYDDNANTMAITGSDSGRVRS